MPVTKAASDTTTVQTMAICELSDRLDQLFAEDHPRERLGACMITFSRPSGRAKALGFYHPAGWVDEKGLRTVAEIAINPEAMALYGFQEVIQTLCHEKGHQWQEEHGKPSRSGYHNSEWSEKMQRIGLMPSDTGEPGGKRTGQRMDDYVIPGGPLDKMIRRLPKRLRLPFMGLPASQRETPERPRGGYVKFVCESCEGIARAKPSMNLRCDDCDVVMMAEEPEEP